MYETIEERSEGDLQSWHSWGSSHKYLHASRIGRIIQAPHPLKMNREPKISKPCTQTRVSALFLALQLPGRRLVLEKNAEAPEEFLTSDLQRGQRAFIASHLSTHSVWKKWVQGSSRSSSLSRYLAKHMQQTYTNGNVSILIDISGYESSGYWREFWI